MPKKAVSAEIEAYLSGVSRYRKDRFAGIIDLVKALYPRTVESMRYRMPTYEHDEGWVAVANQKNYLSLYTCSPQHIAGFKKKHPKIKTGKGCINFRDSDPIPLDDLIPVIKSAMEFRYD